jgi:hypothetical protein
MDSTTYNNDCGDGFGKCTKRLFPSMNDLSGMATADFDVPDCLAVRCYKEHPLKEYPTHGQRRRKCRCRKHLYLYGNSDGTVKSGWPRQSYEEDESRGATVLKGHGFSRAGKRSEDSGALAPEGCFTAF